MTHQEIKLPDLPSLYDKTGNITDHNTLLINRDELRRLIAEAEPVSIAQALESNGCERIKDFYQVGSVQRAAVESFAAALGHGETVNQMLLEALKEALSALKLADNHVFSITTGRGKADYWSIRDAQEKCRAVLAAQGAKT